MNNYFKFFDYTGGVEFKQEEELVFKNNKVLGKSSNEKWAEIVKKDIDKIDNLDRPSTIDIIYLHLLKEEENKVKDTTDEMVKETTQEKPMSNKEYSIWSAKHLENKPIKRYTEEEIKNAPSLEDSLFAEWTKLQGKEERPEKFAAESESNGLDKHGNPKFTKGIKESKGKLFYELDFNFISQMAERMNSNKSNGKYPRWNWKKDMDVEEIAMAIFRHTLDIMEGNYEDDGRKYGHIEALATNAMILNYILKNKNK